MSSATIIGRAASAGFSRIFPDAPAGTYRETKRAEGLAVAVLDGGLGDLAGDTSLRAGHAPMRRHVGRDADEAEFVIATLRRWLAERPGGDICLVARTNRLLSRRYRELLERAGIACVVVEKDSDADLPRASSVAKW